MGAYFCSITLFIGPYLQLSSILVFFRISRHGSCQKCMLLFPQTVCLILNTNSSWDRSCCSRELVWNRVLLSYRFPIAGSKPCCHVSPAHDAWLPFVSDWCLRPTAASLVLAPVHPRCSQRLKRFLVHGTHCSFLALLYNDKMAMSIVFIDFSQANSKAHS